MSDRPIPTPGIYFDIPAREYFAWDACNASALKVMARSAAHYRWQADNPKEATPAMIQGSCTHTAVLEPDKLATRYVVSEDCCATKGSGGQCTNAGKIRSGGQWYCGVHGKKVTPDVLEADLDEDGELIESPVVTADQMAKAQAMAISVQRNRASRDLLEPCRKEVCIVWIDPVTKVLCKARLDAYDPMSLKIPDLKTCEDASEDGFQRAIADHGYHIQAAFYLDAATSVSGEIHDGFYFIAVEKAAPFVSAVYKCHQELIQLGQHRYRKLLTDYQWCKENNLWPGYHDHQIVPVGVSRWFFDKESKK